MSRPRDTPLIAGGPMSELEPIVLEHKRRPKVTPRVRDRIYARDHYACCNCGNDERGQLTLDHKRPLAKGGTNAESNLETLCYACNQDKGDARR